MPRPSVFCSAKRIAPQWWSMRSQNIAKPIGVSTYRVTRELPAPIREELPSVEDLQEVVIKLRSEMDLLRQERQDE